MSKVTLGGDRLGSGDKNKVHLKNYERSNHDLSYAWRSTMSAGTLVPFLTEVALPGDTHEIDLNVDVLTHPTIGPLFGSYKVQLDIFSVPIRLYNAKLNMNMTGVGLKMADIKLPQINLHADEVTTEELKELILENKYENYQINPSSILSYLNIRGLGSGIVETIPNDRRQIQRNFNAIPFLAYWDIYKQYYANKQEEIGAVIHTALSEQNYEIDNVEFQIGAVTTNLPKIEQAGGGTDTFTVGANNPQLRVELVEASPYSQKLMNELVIYLGGGSIPEGIEIVDLSQRGYGVLARDFFRLIQVTPAQEEIVSFEGSNWEKPHSTDEWEGFVYGWSTTKQIKVSKELEIHTFPLSFIDDERLDMLKETEATHIITSDSRPPYGFVLDNDYYTKQNGKDLTKYSIQYSQEGLGLKTYQSDLFNNWMATEWIDGENGVNQLSRINIQSDELTDEQYLTVDQILISTKVYEMLTRIAISGGTYDDWLNATYTHERVRQISEPMYCGGLSTELIFEEVINNSASEVGGETQPLGTLAGRGKISGRYKGGKTIIKTHEPSYILGIVSLTPRLDYSQGNKWDTDLKTLDDFHKPALDEIGFQDLITEQMAWFDTTIESVYKTQYSAGKTPAWINYMTNVNQTRGNFADPDNQMWMTLNRKYEVDENTGRIKDLTTYIDPTKFNHIFAYTKLDAQNFWTQIGVGMKARRKMSSKVMPNL